MPTMNQLQNAANGKFAASGGLNIKDIKEYLIANGRSNVGTREQLEEKLQALLVVTSKEPTEIIFKIHPKNDKLLVNDTEYNQRYIIDKRAYILILDFQFPKSYRYLINNDGTPVTDKKLLTLANTVMFDCYYRKVRELHGNGITLILRNNYIGCHKFNKDIIDKLLSGLNQKIQKTCPSMSLEFNHTSELQGKLSTYTDADMLGLCLYHNENCIASIMVDLDTKIMEIYSFTLEQYRGKRYNKLLRAMIFLICSVLICGDDLKFTHFRSVAENPISAYTLMKEFKVTVEIPKRHSELYQKHMTSDTNWKTDLFAFYKAGGYLKLLINIEENLDTAHKILNQMLVDGISCP
jgi:hypothetical protein